MHSAADAFMGKPTVERLESKKDVGLKDYDISYKMLDDERYCQAKSVYKFLKHNAMYNSIFIDECCLRWEQDEAKSDGYYFYKCATLTSVKNFWLALHRVSSYRYTNEFKGKANYKMFQDTFREAHLQYNLRNPKEIAEHAEIDLDEQKKNQVARVPENIIRGLPPKVLHSDPNDKSGVTMALEEAFDCYLNKENNKEKIILMLPSSGYISEDVLTESIRNLITKFGSQVKFFAWFAFAEYDDILDNIERELAPIAPSPSSSTSTTEQPTSQKNSVSVDVKAFLDEKQNACLVTDYLMMEGYEAPTIVSLFGDISDKNIVTNYGKPNFCCRCTAQLIVVSI